MLNDVNINKVRGGLGRREPSSDMVSGLIANGVAVTGGVQLDTVYRILSVKEAEDLLLDEDYDTTNTVLVYEHIKEFFRINPNGDLYLLVKDQTESYVDLAKELPFLTDEADGKINQAGIAYNPSTAVVDTTELLAAVAEAEIQAANLYIGHKPVLLVLEGKGYDINTPDDFRGLNAENVAVVVAQDFSVTSANTANETYAAIGTALGAISRASVHVGIDYVNEFNMQGGSLSIASISNERPQTLSTSLLDTANDQGAIFFRKHVGIAGIYFNDTHTCTASTDDFAYIENLRTINKATRIVRATLLPDLGGPVDIDPNSGELDATFVQSMKAKVEKAITEQMSGELSGFTFFIDPNQDVLATSLIETNLSLVPFGKAREIVANIGFTNPN